MQGDQSNTNDLHCIQRIADQCRDVDGAANHKTPGGTHGQWLYSIIQVHDKVAGTLATLRKEEIQMEIEKQQALGLEGILDEDCHLGQCNLWDLGDTLGIKETYWHLAIKAVQEASRLEALRTQTVAAAPTT
jgi:hypothetical protein